MKLYVIRHGEVDINKKGLLNGRNNTHLTTTGINQAKQASELLKNIKIDIIICSPLKRTIETTEIININHIPVIYDNRILERDTKGMMYQSFKQVNLNYFYNLESKILYKDCEGFKSIMIRVTNFIEDIQKQYKEKSVLVVTHGDICKAIYCYFNHISDVSKIIQFQQDNGAIAQYEI